MRNLKWSFWAIVAAAGAAPASAVQDAPIVEQAEKPAIEPGPFIIFFEWDGRTLGRDGEAILSEVLAAYRSAPHYRLTLTGHSDRSGPADVNRRISRLRAMVVHDYLLSHGVNSEDIQVEAAGEEELLIATQDGVREAQNRRVEVNFSRRGY